MPYVTNVVAKQRYPWNGLVDVKYEIVGSTNEINGYVYGSLKAEDRGTGKVYPASTFVKPLDLSEGEHQATWDMAADFEVVSTNVVFSVSIEKLVLYMVVDLSGGPNAASYPVSYLSGAPEGGWADEYKTTKLVLRLIEPGSFKMGGAYDVTLTKPYYMGVFEVTQKQYELIMGNNPSQFKGDTRPVDQVSWNMIRGNSNSYVWPNIKTVDSNSFVGLLRSKTGLSLDLPTEAQWEYACRAGTTSDYNNGGGTEEDLKKLGRYRGNRNDGRGGYSEHTTVGFYAPNAWGLYDMHGNVWEWCLDWQGHLSNGIDPLGSVSGSQRVIRGGCWNCGARDCTSSRQFSCSPALGYPDDGIRLVRTILK